MSVFSGAPVVGPLAWTPADVSGGLLTFSNVNCKYTIIGNLVFAYGTLTYPSNTDANHAAFSLPVPVPNQSYAAAPSVAGGAGGVIGTALEVIPLKNSTPGVANFGKISDQSLQTNQTVSGRVVNFMLVYPVN